MKKEKEKESNLFEKESEMTFEESFKRLEAILSKLENEIEDYSLDDVITHYQEGLRLLKICRKKLSEAELKIEKISAEEKN